MEHSDILKNKTAVLITKHKKDEVVFPLLAQTGMNLKLLDTIDTDTFGAFTLAKNVGQVGARYVESPFHNKTNPPSNCLSVV